MFKRIAAEALGISDVGVIISPNDYDKVDADDYLFSEDGEKIFFLIKSKKDEYCFTNLALIHVDGDSAISSKRVIHRYDYSSYHFSQVSIETAGTIDLDIELKFTLNEDKRFSIDVRKNFIEQLKDIYKALTSIGKIQRQNALAKENAHRCLETVGSMYKINNIPSSAEVVAHYNALLDNFNGVTLDRYMRRDFSQVFEKYIHA